MLVVLWLFQTVFLDSFYRRIKISQIEKLSLTISNQLGSDDFESNVIQLARDNEFCVLVVNRRGEVLHSIEGVLDCVIHRGLPPSGFLDLVNKADSNGGMYLEKLQSMVYQSVIAIDTIRRFPPPRINSTDSMIHVRRVASGRENVYIILNSNIVPVLATVETLRIQLVYISIVLIALALFLALFISKRIATPIMSINESAKLLAKGDYNVGFEAEGYKEIGELNDTLNTAAYELSRVENLRRELIANVSHDLRTPLTMITGFAEVIRDLPGENTPENAQVIVEEANSLNRLVSDLLDISKLQSGTGNQEKTSFSLTKCIDEVVCRMNKLIGTKRIEFIYDKEAYVIACYTQISQVVYNLITNAISYSDGSIVVNQLISNNKVKMEVVDCGLGISDKDIPHIWDRYYRVDKKHKRSSYGTGIGLSIVREIMKQHEGTYGVFSRENEGSTFWIELEVEDM